MYNSKLAVCIKAAGKVLREQKDQVFLPFGSEYSIFIKNLNSVRALVRLNLDGVDVTDGTDLVVQANGSIDLERFMKKGNLSQGNRFKFIERTGKVEAHRGIQAEDGLLRVEFQFEKVAPKVETVVVKTVHEHHHRDYWDYWHRPYWYGGCFGGPYYSGVHYNCSQQLIGGSGAIDSAGLSGISNTLGDASSYSEPSYTATASGAAQGSGGVSSVAMSFNSNGAVPMNSGAGVASAASSKGTMRSLVSQPTFSGAVMDSYVPEANDAGITVPGSISNQHFSVVSSFPVDDEKFVIILKLLGETRKGKAVKQAVTVKHAQTCVTCGTRNRGKLAQFCRDCGTALEVA